MSGETGEVPSGWAVDTLKVWADGKLADHARLDDTRFEALEATIKTAVTSAKEAVDKAEKAAEKRLDGLNELRGAMNDQAAKYMTQETADAKISAISARLDLIKERQDRMEGRGSGLQQGWGYVVGAVGLALALLSAFNLLHK